MTTSTPAFKPLGRDILQVAHALRTKQLHAGLGGPTVAAVRKVEFDLLEDDDKVVLDGFRLVVDPRPLQSLKRALATSVAFQRHSPQLAALLYVLHELVHIPQGIGSMSTVRALRTAGGERELLQLDLAADHAAASMVASARQHLSLAALKEIQAAGLTAFPVDRTHGAAARRRKARRQLSVLCDAMVRRHRAVAARDLPPDAYVSVCYRSCRGQLILLRHGVLPGILARGTITPQQATLFDNAAGEPPSSLMLLPEVELQPERRLSLLRRELRAAWPDLRWRDARAA